MPLHSISFKDSKFAVRVGGDRTFTFPKQGVTILCGPNGSGKSTILSSLRPGPVTSGRGVVFADVKKTKDTGVIHYDFDLDSPRGNAGSFGGMAARHKSHGQVSDQVLTALVDGLERVSASQSLLFVLDEPEQAFDVDNLERLHAWLHQLDQRPKTQVIVATHSPYLILDPTFHVIEMIPGYLNKVRDHVRKIPT